MLTALIVVLVIVAAFLVLLAFRPGTFRVQRSAIIAAPAERIYPRIADFHADGWGGWSPWETVDADLKRSYSGATAGLGAIYNWEGKNAGTGRMEIIRVAEPNRIDIQLDFYKPFRGNNLTEFTIDPVPEGHRVTWTMTGPVPYLARALHLAFNMDKMIGGQFDKGLAALKTQAEAA